MKKFWIIISLVFSGLCLGACGNQKIESEKQILESREGKLTVKSGEVYLLSTEKGIVNITSTKVNLDSYLKKNIKVSGMFSGETLYVDKIEQN